MGILYDMVNCKTDILMVYADMDSTEDVTKPNNANELSRVGVENTDKENKKECV